ncbi:MAG: tripartite tricarboxylate transporter TctB family protein [Hyphomicrobiaceae bacterium]
MHDKDADADGPSLVSSRTMDIAVALVLLMGSIIVIFDSARAGFGWRDDGPAPGFFPFWVALVLAIASVMNLIRALPDKEAAAEGFVGRAAFNRVLAVLLPTTLYVAAIGGIELGPLKLPGLGMYIASAVFIAAFMWMLSAGAPAAIGAKLGGAVGIMLAAAALTSALLWLVSKGNLPLAALDIPFALVLAIMLVALPLGVLAKIVTLGPAVAIVLYCMFEVWFRVPLVKGPIEAMLGLG